MKISNRTPKMRHLIILLSCTAMIGLMGVQSSAGANHPPNENPEARIDKRIEEMTEILSLTETRSVSGWAAEELDPKGREGRAVQRARDIDI